MRRRPLHVFYGRPRSRKGEAVRGWKPHLPRVAFSRDRRGQDARAPRGDQSNAAISWQRAVIGSSTIGTTGQPAIRPSENGRTGARPSPACETRAVMCLVAGARTARSPRVVFCRVRWQVVVFSCYWGCFHYLTDNSDPHHSCISVSHRRRCAVATYTIYTFYTAHFPRSVSGGVGINRSFNPLGNGLGEGGRAVRAPAMGGEMRGWKPHHP